LSESPRDLSALKEMKAGIEQALLLPFAVNMGKLEIGIFRMLRERPGGGEQADLLSGIGRSLRLVVD
jgi:hypothetical protein